VFSARYELNSHNYLVELVASEGYIFVQTSVWDILIHIFSSTSTTETCYVY
jgi:hypothetical protein